MNSTTLQKLGPPGWLIDVKEVKVANSHYSFEKIDGNFLERSRRVKKVFFILNYLDSDINEACSDQEPSACLSEWQVLLGSTIYDRVAGPLLS